MKFKIVLSILFLFRSYEVALAQDQNSVWIFGDSAGIDFHIPSNPIYINSGMNGRGSCVSICDTSGNLQLYSFTIASYGSDWSTQIYNYLDQKVLGADSITGEGWYNELVFIPKPGSSNIFYLFSSGTDVTNHYEGVYYTIVDLTQNGGNGAVILENIRLGNYRPGDCLSAIKHANGRDWWVISKFSDRTLTSNLNRFFVNLVTPDSIYAPIIQDFNDARDVDFQKLIFKASGDTFMMINVRGYMAEFAFDRCSGIITPIRSIYPELINQRYFWEGAYSPNGNVFYVTTNEASFIPTGYLIQYDLTTSNIQASADTLDSFLYPIGTGAVRLAPDGKIYFTRAYECNAFPYCFPYPDSIRNYVNQNLSVINNPDVAGSGCNYQPFSFYLGGKRTYYGLPNNPNYGLGPVIGSVCDSLLLSQGQNIEKPMYILVSPNPCKNFIQILYEGFDDDDILLSITDAFGSEIFKKNVKLFTNNFSTTIDVEALSSGVYFIHLENEKRRITRKIIKQ